MKDRLEVLAWLAVVLITVSTSLAIVQGLARLAFASASHLTLEATVVHAKAAGYESDDSKLRVPALDESEVAQAQAENELLRRVQADHSALSLSGPETGPSLLPSLVVSLTATQTQLIMILPSATLPLRATATLKPSRTWTATVTSLPSNTRVASATAIATVSATRTPSR